jgi:hypothetical protein
MTPAAREERQSRNADLFGHTAHALDQPIAAAIEVTHQAM